MTNPHLSIVIPTYNSAHYLKPLLKSIFSSKFSDFEIIVVDDMSNDNSKQIIQKFSKVRYMRLKRRSGPSIARNKGAELAQGKIIVFADSDVIFLKNTLSELVRTFKKNSQIVAVSGFYSKKPANSGFFAKYKALRDYLYWNAEIKDNSIGIFSARIGAIKKETFKEIGGFNPHYKQLEDYEFSYRLTQKYPIYFNSKVQVKHHFGDFFTVAKNYFKRSIVWISFFPDRRKLDKVAVTFPEILNMLMAVFIFTLIISAIFIKSFFILILILIFLIVRIFLSRKFLSFTISQEGFIFMLGSFFVHYILHLIIFVGAFLGFLKNINRFF